MCGDESVLLFSVFDVLRDRKCLVGCKGRDKEHYWRVLCGVSGIFTDIGEKKTV